MHEPQHSVAAHWHPYACGMKTPCDMVTAIIVHHKPDNTSVAGLRPCLKPPPPHTHTYTVSTPVAPAARHKTNSCFD
jgi:hypothetical protein